jgi:hypothetical protein
MKRAAAPPGPLLALTAVVLVAHALLLGPSADSVQAPSRATGPPFVTRTVTAQPMPAMVPVTLDVPAVPPVGVVSRKPKTPRLERAPVDTAPIAHATPATVMAEAPTPASPSATGQALTLAIPGPARLHYRVDLQVRGLALQAAGELLWRHDGETYDARLEVKAPFLPTRTQHSNGRLTAEGLAPLRFSDKRTSEEATHFERDKGKVSFSSNRPDAPLLAGAQDRLSVLLQLAAMVAGKPAKFPSGTAITVQTAGTREAEPWVFVVEGEEQLQLPGGHMSALKLTRSPRKEFDTKVELWLAPGMDYVPVRLRLTQPNGDSVDQQWSSTDRG